MAGLRLSDLRQAFALAGEVSAVDTPAELPGALLPDLMALVGADGAVYHWIAGAAA